MKGNSRVLKFRAWDKKNKRMVVDVKIDKTFELSGATINSYLNDLNEFYEVMQYTGLKDKNGNPIYEGDIVTEFVKAPNEAIYKSRRFTGVVKEEPPQFIISNVLVEPENIRDTRRKLTKYCEVIGNVWENKELLK